MTTKLCPYCAEEIQQDAMKCKHCGSWLAAPGEAPGAIPPPGKPGLLVGTGPAGVDRLTRSATNKMLAGTCAGLGKYLGMDPTLVRILYALATFFTGIAPGIIVYVILAFVIPSEETPAP